MILQLYNHIGTSRDDEDVDLPDLPIPRIGEWIRFHKDEAGWRKGIYRVVSVDYVIQRGKLVASVTAWAASDQHYEMAQTAIHDEHGDSMIDLIADPTRSPKR